MRAHLRFGNGLLLVHRRLGGEQRVARRRLDVRHLLLHRRTRIVTHLHRLGLHGVRNLCRHLGGRPNECESAAFRRLTRARAAVGSAPRALQPPLLPLVCPQCRQAGSNEAQGMRTARLRVRTARTSATAWLAASSAALASRVGSAAISSSFCCAASCAALTALAAASAMAAWTEASAPRATSLALPAASAAAWLAWALASAAAELASNSGFAASSAIGGDGAGSSSTAFAGSKKYSTGASLSPSPLFAFSLRSPNCASTGTSRLATAGEAWQRSTCTCGRSTTEKPSAAVSAASMILHGLFRREGTSSGLNRLLH